MKNFYLTFFIILFSFSAMTQSFKGGVMTGLSTSQLDGDTYSGYHRAGIIGGAYIEHNISNKTSWQLEMKFIQKGSYKGQNSNAGDFSTYSLRLNYIEVPAMIKYKFKNKLTFEGGLSFAYLASYKEGNEYGQNTGILLHKFDFNYHLGAYFKLFEKLSVNVRYSYSFIPIRSGINGENKYLFQKGQFNNVITFSFYYKFNKQDA